MAKDDATIALLHTDDPNAPTEIEGYSVADLTLATSGFIRVFSAISATAGTDMAMSALMSALVSIGPQVLAEDDLTQVLRETLEKLPGLYAKNAERNRRASLDLRGALEARKDLN